MNVHEGHRARLRNRYLEQGLNGFNDLNALELLLFHVIPRKDTNPIAHALLDKFGTLAGVFDANIQELQGVPGIGENAAVLITLIPQIMRKAMISETADMKIINSTEDAGRYLTPKFKYENEEILLLICLDNKNKILSCTELGRGSVNAVHINARKIAEQALMNKASSVIIAHNHPHSFAMPSREDIEMTRYIKNALKNIDITLRDHIIVVDDDWVSMLESNERLSLW